MHFLESELLILLGLYVFSDRLRSWYWRLFQLLSFIPTINGSYSDRFFSKRICSIWWFKYFIRGRWDCLICTNRVEILFRVILGIGALFRVGTPHSSIPFRITFRSCQGKPQKHGCTCLLRITMSLQIISLEKFIWKGRIENFYSVWLFRDRRNVPIGLNYIELQKISTQYKHSLYNQPGISKMSYSI